MKLRLSLDLVGLAFFIFLTVYSIGMTKGGSTQYAAIFGMTSAVRAEKIIKLHHLNKDEPVDNPTGAMATVFKSLVEAGTDGAIKVQTFPSGQLGKDAEAVQQVKAGVIRSGIHSVGRIASSVR